MKHSLVCLTVILGSAGAAPLASAAVVFSQPPVSALQPAVLSVSNGRVAAPFIAPGSAQMTGLSFWAYNGNVPPQSMTVTFELFAEAPGGGVGAALFATSAPLASLTSETTGNIFTDKYTFSLPVSQPLIAGSRYFLSVSGDLSGFFAWVLADSGEKIWVSPGGGPFIPAANDDPTAFEILGDPIAIPLPSGAAMAFAGLGVMAGFRRRRAAI